VPLHPSAAYQFIGKLPAGCSFRPPRAPRSAACWPSTGWT
jgi:hypothetical protein